MFSNKKRCFPSGTFIATPLRVIVIIQLCIAFTLLVSYAGYPFMGELFEIKSGKILYEAVMGKGDTAVAAHFSKLPYQERRIIEEEYGILQQRSQKSVGEKLNRSIKILISEIPPFEKAWLTFSIVISILLLLRIEGAATAAWILPLIVVVYSVDNTIYGYSGIHSKEAALFPTEQQIVEKYLKEPLNPNILDQKEQLLRGWRYYLIREWATEIPSKNDEVFQNQAKKGEFHFNLARISALTSEPYPTDRIVFHPKVSPVILLSYLVWNLFFAWFINRKKWWVAA